MFDQSKSCMLLTGRILLGLIFVLAGVMKIINWSATAEYMASRGMPAVPILQVGAILVEVGGGLSVILGVQTRIGAYLNSLWPFLACYVAACTHTSVQGVRLATRAGG